MQIVQVGMAMAALVFVMGPAVEHTQAAESERCPNGALCLFDEEERMTANIEYAPPDVLREAQNAGLQPMIERATRVEFYRQRLASYGIDSAKAL
jgi:hypothetical protein